MILAHLVSEQPLPNLLAALAVKPDRVVLLQSASKRFDTVVRNLRRASESAGLRHATHPLALASPNPTPDDVIAALDACPTEWRPTLLNLTGGTKLMAFGAQTWAARHATPAFYVDTAGKRFIQVGEHPLPPLPELTATARTLDLSLVLAAHGIPTDKLTGHAPTPAELTFGRAAAAAWQNLDACRSWLDQLRGHWFIQAGRYAHHEAWRTPVAIPPAAASLAEAAAAAGWGLIDSAGRFVPQFPLPVARDKTAREAGVSALLKNLEGGWFELLVADQMTTSGHFRDLRWSVESSRADLGLGENDLVGLDQRTLSPVFVSCKSSTSLTKPLEHIFSLQQRATHFGGTFATAVLCIARVHSADDEKRLREFCRAARVIPVIGDADRAAWLT